MGIISSGFDSFFAVLYIPFNIGELGLAFLLLLVMLLPTLYVLGKDLKLMFRIPKRKDILPVVVVVVLQIIYSLAVIFLLSALGLSEHTPSEDTVVSVIIIIAMIIQVLGGNYLRLFYLFW